MLIVVGILFGGIFIWKLIGGILFKRYMASQIPIATVSTMTVKNQPWLPTIKAVGSLRAIKGVDVTSEIAGLVKKIEFTPGSYIAENTLLVQLNADAEIGQLNSLKAQAKLAELTYNRDKAQYAIHAISKQTLDVDFQNWQSLLGQVAQQQAIVEKKSIRAPFTGRLGINNVNPGQFINPGDKIVSLQTIDPIYFDFDLPQQMLVNLKVGQEVTLVLDMYLTKLFKGTITTIDPALDSKTRNVRIEATIKNPNGLLKPGMFATAEVTIGKPSPYLTVPQTAISFNPYGNIVFIVEKDKLKKQKNKNTYPVKQIFVITGESRGDQITILKGLKAGDEIVTTGQLKLKNGTTIAINNKIQPDNNPNPDTPNEH